MTKQYLLGIIILLLLTACNTQKEIDTLTADYFLVRHAEKVSAPRDPGLSKEGKERAYFLVQFLKAEKIDAVYSTDYYRTRKTAQPTCSARALNMEIYDASDLATFAQSIKQKHPNGNVLIVGHSNTTPQLASHLAGKKIADSLQDWQYDQLFKVSIYSSGKTEVEQIKFGKTSLAP